MIFTIKNFLKYVVSWLLYFILVTYLAKVQQLLQIETYGVVIGLGFCYWFLNVVQLMLVPKEWFLTSPLLGLLFIGVLYTLAAFSINGITHGISMVNHDFIFNFDNPVSFEFFSFHALLGFGAFVSKLYWVRALCKSQQEHI